MFFFFDDNDNDNKPERSCCCCCVVPVFAVDFRLISFLFRVQFLFVFVCYLSRMIFILIVLKSCAECYNSKFFFVFFGRFRGRGRRGKCVGVRSNNSRVSNFTFDEDEDDEDGDDDDDHSDGAGVCRNPATSGVVQPANDERKRSCQCDAAGVVPPNHYR